MGIEIFEYREYTVLAFTLVKIWEFSAFNEVLINQFINELIKYWTPDINKSIVICKFWVYIRNLDTRINLDFNLQCIYTIFSWVTVIVKFVPLVAEIHIANMGNFKKLLERLYMFKYTLTDVLTNANSLFNSDFLGGWPIRMIVDPVE